MNKYLTAITAAALLLLACKKDPSKEALPADKPVYFTGITYITENAQILIEDTTDWRTDDVWTEKEANLFGKKYNTNCLADHINEKEKVGQSANETADLRNFIIAYPNPNQGILALNADYPDSTQVELRLVDKKFKILFSLDSLPKGQIIFDLTYLNLNDTVRFYYRFIKNNCEQRGHGDILFQK